MAGLNPGMIIKVAADISEAVRALGQVVTAEADLESSTKDVNRAFDALDVAVGTFAANAAAEIFKLAFDAVQALGQEIFGVIDQALGLRDAYKEFKEAVSDAIRESGVLQAGIDALTASLLEAFGGSREEAVQAIARAINTGTIAALRLLEAVLWLGEKGVQGVMALIVPFDALWFSVNYVMERLQEFEASLYEMSAKIPGVGGNFAELAVEARKTADEFKANRDASYNTMIAHQALVRGEGAVFDASREVRQAILDATVAMQDQQVKADASTGSIKNLTDANVGLVQGSGEAVVALYNQTEQLQKMDEWSRAIKNTDPYAYLAQGMTKVLPPLAVTTTALDTTTTAMKTTATAAIDMSDDVKFAAEVVQRAAVTWSEAMDLVRRGQGTMTGTIGPAVRPPGMSDSEWALMQSDPRAWEAQHGYDWDAPHAGTASAWSMGGSAAPVGGSTVNQSVTVNTVAGDSQAIARVVKDALADDWRRQGLRG